MVFQILFIGLIHSEASGSQSRLIVPILTGLLVHIPTLVEGIEILSSDGIYARRRVARLVHDAENAVKVVSEDPRGEVHSDIEGVVSVVHVYIIPKVWVNVKR
jgi:hypothetical protein|tara:strand:- start:32 stop:340 length:309 start_codon:yes stop_codon:yes gene_type:complete